MMGLIDALTGMSKRILGTTNESLLKGYLPFVRIVSQREAGMRAGDDAALRALGTGLKAKLRANPELIDQPEIRAEVFALVREVADRQLGMWNAVRKPHADWQEAWWAEAADAVATARERIAGGTPHWEIDLPAAVYERIRIRFPESVPPFRMRAHDVQLIGGAVLHDGKIAEQKTGEGKTLAAVFAASLNGMTGRGVHIVTVNDYLAKRDAGDNRPVYSFLGLAVGCVIPDLDPIARKEAYAADITHGTTSEFGFDYLRDNLKQRLEDQCQTRRHFAIVDEVDSVLIDEARVPLIISGPAQGRMELYPQADAVARQLVKGEDFEVDVKDRTATLTDGGTDKATKLFGIKSMYEGEGMHLPHFLDNALKAHHLFHKDKEYMVVGGEVKIVDEFTGRVLSGRRWSEGLHQAIEAKEGVAIQPETMTYATITLQNFFRLYIKLAGMTGTAMTEANEFNAIYKLIPVSIPTNKPVTRVDHADLIYGSEPEKADAIVEEVAELHAIGQPVLVGTITVETSEKMSELFKRKGIVHSVLNARQHAKEAEVVLGAGAVGAVTIATNMAGRGTDIKLGRTSFVELLKHWKHHDVAPKKIMDTDPKLDEAVVDLWSKRYLGDEAAEKLRGQSVAQILEAVNKERKQRGWHPLPLPSSLRGGVDARVLGGLRIVGTERHDARRIDNQLRGRSGRQGDPGSSRFYLSLEDSLMKRFAGPTMANLMRSMGLKNGVPIESRMVSRSIEKAQKRVEEYNFGIRKNLLEYDQVMNLQRQNIYGLRQAVLEGKELEARYLRNVELALDDLIQEAAADGTRGDPLAQRIAPAFEQELGLPAPEPSSIPVKDGGDACRNRLMEPVRSALDLRKTAFGPELYAQIARFVLLESIDRRWKDHIDFMDHLRRGIGLESYGQKDPKMRFKEEGFKSFEAMTKLIRHDVARIFFRLQVQAAPNDDQPPRNMFEAGGFQPRDAPAVPRAHTVPEIPAIREPAGTVASAPAPGMGGPKPGPDAPCPCGSGDRFKYCHGKV